MPGGGSGFDGDEFGGMRYHGLYMGKVVNREDPNGDGRVRVQIPGLIDDASAWAKPKGMGYIKWGAIRVPPLEADVYVQFLNGELDQPVYEPADAGTRGQEGEREMFPEFEHPDIIVAGFGPFRLVIDTRDDPDAGLVPSLRIKQVASLESGETDTAWFELRENSAQMRGDSVAQVTSGALTDIDSDGDVQVKRRKVMPTEKPISG